MNLPAADIPLSSSVLGRNQVSLQDTIWPYHIASRPSVGIWFYLWSFVR